MNYRLEVIFSFSIIIPAIIGWIRFQKINPAYYPFLICISIGLVNEILSYILTQTKHTTAINNNIYLFAESILITWQFKRWRLFERSGYLFRILLFSYFVFWTVESFIFKRINYPFSYFSIYYSLIIALMSVNIINRELIRERQNIFKNSIFLICLVFVFYFTYWILVATFLLYGLGAGIKFLMALFAILVYVNLCSNLIFALAVLWMPARHRFSLPY